jgi:hypothetical protein
VTSLEGYTLEVLDNEKELTQCLQMIVEQNGESIKKYMNPFVFFSCILIGCAGKRMIENGVKNSIVQPPIINL